MVQDKTMVELLAQARDNGEFLLVHGQTQRQLSASMTLGRCFQSEPEVLLIGFEPEAAKGQLKEILHVLAQTFGIPEKLEDSNSSVFLCSTLTLKDWFQSEYQVEQVVRALTQSIPLERLTDFLELAQVCVVTDSKI